MTAVVGDLGGAGFAAAPGVVNQYTRERAVQSGPLGGFRSPGQRFAQKVVPETAFAGPGLREQSGPGRLPEQRTHLVEGHGGGIGEHVEPEPCPQQGGEVQQPRGTGRQFGGTGADRVADPDGHGGRRGLGTGPLESAARPEELGHEERATARVPGQGVRGRRLGSAVRRGVEQGRDVLVAEWSDRQRASVARELSAGPGAVLPRGVVVTGRGRQQDPGAAHGVRGL